MGLKIKFHLFLSFFTTGVLFPFSQTTYAVDLKRFDAPKPERASYLSFRAPPRLRFTPLPVPADRTKLIRMDVTLKPETPKQEDNSTVSPPDFPIVEYSTDDRPSSVKIPSRIPQMAPSSVLPLADPFEGVDGTNVGTTDELLDVFDQLRISSRPSGMKPIPFIPPYTVAPDNMKIETKARYRRVQR